MFQKQKINCEQMLTWRRWLQHVPPSQAAASPFWLHPAILLSKCSLLRKSLTPVLTSSTFHSLTCKNTLGRLWFRAEKRKLHRTRPKRLAGSKSLSRRLAMWNSVIRYSSLSVVAVLITASSLWSQAGGTIRGTLQDPSGAVVANARVTAVNVATGIQTQVLSTEAGNYNIPNLAAGMYRVEAEASGFKKLLQGNIRVNAGVIA